MKTTLIIIGSAVILILLIVRMIYIHSDQEDALRKEFVSKLDYNFSAVVDSVALVAPQAPVGFIYLKPNLDTIVNREKKISRTMNEKRRWRFLDPVKRSRVRMFSRDARLYKVGDSVHVDTSMDKMLLFHDRSLVREFTISKEVRN